MADQERVARPHHVRRDEKQAEEVKATEAKNAHEKNDKLKQEIDALLDEIDGVLEENAEEFVKAYVQKGGE